VFGNVRPPSRLPRRLEAVAGAVDLPGFCRGEGVRVKALADAVDSLLQMMRIVSSLRATVRREQSRRSATSSLVRPSIFQTATRRRLSAPSSPSSRSYSSATWAANPGVGSSPTTPSMAASSASGPHRVRVRTYPVSVEPTEPAKAAGDRPRAETFPVTVEADRLVLDL
jgi:hypothetical protein